MDDVIHWITEHKEESAPNRKVSHSHPDPTANEAIGQCGSGRTQEEVPLKETPEKGMPGKETSTHRCLAGRGGEAG